MEHLLNLSPICIPFGAHIQLHKDTAVQLPRDGCQGQGSRVRKMSGVSAPPLAPCLTLRPDLLTLPLLLVSLYPMQGNLKSKLYPTNSQISTNRGSAH